jgi:hypothetical protein
MIHARPHPDDATRRPRRAAAWLLAALCAALAVPAGAAEETGAADKEKEEEQAGEPSGGTEVAGEETAERKAPGAPPPQPRAAAPAHRGQAARPGTAPGAAGQAPAPAPPLRFTDEDLEKYHRRPAPLEEDDAAAAPAAATGPAAPPAPAVAPAPATAAPAGPAVPQTLPRRPRPKRQPPPPDPLKTFKDREAMAKFRAEQIQALRDRVRQLEGRIGYLRSKQQALASGLYPPLPPPQGEEDRAKDADLKVSDLLKDIEAEIKALEPELETAREDLVQAELRFGTGASIP